MGCRLNNHNVHYDMIRSFAIHGENNQELLVKLIRGTHINIKT